MSDLAALDDAAYAALYAIARERPQHVEHLGVLYGDDYARSNIVSQRQDGSVSGRFSVPAGSLKALFHNHPPGGERSEFSPKDKMAAKRLGVPSYIDVGDRVRRYDPSTGKTSDVLAQIPIEEIRTRLMRTLLEREPDDPRGLMR